MSEPHYTLDAALDHLQRIKAMPSRSRRLVIRKFNPGGMTGHQTVEVDSIHAGFDWEAGKVVITPAEPMTVLTPEQVADITKSVRAGGSWHAYEARKSLRERALKAEASAAALMIAAEELLARCDDADDSCHGTLGTRFVRDTLRAALTPPVSPSLAATTGQDKP